MPEQKIITRELPNVSGAEAVDMLVKIAELAEGLLSLPEWKHKTFAKVQVTFDTEFYKPEKPREDEKYKLRELREYVISFGVHEGSKLDDIPISYLEYLYEAQKELQERLKIYLHHPSIKQDRENE